MRSEIVTCALFFAENLCFGPNFIRKEGTHPTNVHPETENEINTVIFYLELAKCLVLNPDHQTAVAKQYSLENRLRFLKNTEEVTRKKILFAENYLKNTLIQDLSIGTPL